MTTTDHPTEFSAELFGYADSFDVDGYLSMMSDDVHLRFGNGPVASGKDAVREQLSHLMGVLTGMRHRVINEWRIDDTVIHQLEVTYVRRDGNAVTIPAVTIYRLIGRLISEFHNYADLAPLSA
ncbi:nuclear transport factor 2 family protein [Mycobacterium sp. 663a-19]|uniref:nuclear transport factor 2 family protein n=1 Tax=Mycobacterium sp. 663a-19 TaxID=2986148 RepID=UPI002D1ECDA1|nr:nuclear transport factor 2 family protein [Mycobacterium sp. 663a-19]MEB3980117.1 nuclear transport factor 2 family protein [Mycobacterium sp. 663a-19]